MSSLHSDVITTSLLHYDLTSLQYDLIMTSLLLYAFQYINL